MGQIAFDPNEEGGFELVRSIVFERLRAESTWNLFTPQYNDKSFDGYVDYVGDADEGRLKLQSLAQDVFWELIIQGVIAPGAKPAPYMQINNALNLPNFHVTEYGKKVLEARAYLPHDPTGYLDLFRKEIQNPDPTVEAYLSESLNCFRRDNLVACVVMIGVASERAFLLLCESLKEALSNPTEKKNFEDKLKRNSMIAKQDWVLNKVINSIQKQKPKPLPDNIGTILIGVFDFIRCQRNGLGHPQDTPPKVTREEAYVNLKIFPTYFKMLNQVIAYLNQHKNSL